MPSVVASLPSFKGASLDTPVLDFASGSPADAPKGLPDPLVLGVSGIRTKGVVWCRGTVTFYGVSLARGYCPRVEKPWPLEAGAVITRWDWYGNEQDNEPANEAVFSTERAVSPGEVIEADYCLVFDRVVVRLRPDVRATLWQWLKRV